MPIYANFDRQALCQTQLNNGEARGTTIGPGSRIFDCKAMRCGENVWMGVALLQDHHPWKHGQRFMR